MESLLSPEAAVLSKRCQESPDHSSPSTALSACRRHFAGTHALHHLLTAIATGRVTTLDLRKALAAKSRNQTAPSSTVGSSLPSEHHTTDSHTAVYIHESDRGQREPIDSAGLISSGGICAECCSCRGVRTPLPCRLDNIFENLHQQCDKHGRRMVWAAASAGEVFCRPLKSFFARRAVCGFQRELSASQTHAFHFKHDWLWAEAAEAANVENVVHAVEYDEQRLQRCFALLNFQPSHVFHLCFWAASRTLLSQPDACGFNASLFFHLLAAAFPAADDRQPSQPLATRRGASAVASPAATDQATAAAEYLHQALVMPFLLWWRSLLVGPSNSQEALSDEEAASKDGAKRRKRYVFDASEMQNNAKKKRRKGDGNGSRRGRRARLTTWQAVLSAIVEKKTEACAPACAEKVGAAKNSKTLCSVLFPQWKSSYREEIDLLDEWCMTLADGELSRHPKKPSFLQDLASLEDARKYLTLKCSFFGGSPTSYSSKNPNARSPTSDFSTFFRNSCFEPQIYGGESAESSVVHVPHDRIAFWISWVLHRHEILASSSGQ